MKRQNLLRRYDPGAMIAYDGQFVTNGKIAIRRDKSNLHVRDLQILVSDDVKFNTRYDPMTGDGVTIPKIGECIKPNEAKIAAVKVTNSGKHYPRLGWLVKVQVLHPNGNILGELYFQQRYIDILFDIAPYGAKFEVEWLADSTSMQKLYYRVDAGDSNEPLRQDHTYRQRDIIVCLASIIPESFINLSEEWSI